MPKTRRARKKEAEDPLRQNFVKHVQAGNLPARRWTDDEAFKLYCLFDYHTEIANSLEDIFKTGDENIELPEGPSFSIKDILQSPSTSMERLQISPNENDKKLHQYLKLKLVTEPDIGWTPLSESSLNNFDELAANIKKG
jgi:hypothetical protein